QLVQSGDLSLGFGPRVGGRPITVIVCPALATNGGEQLRPHAIRLDTEQPEPLVVARAVDVDHRIRLLGGGQRRSELAEPQLDAEVPTQAVDAGAQQRRLDDLTFTRALALPERTEDPRQDRDR